MNSATPGKIFFFFLIFFLFFSQAAFAALEVSWFSEPADNLSPGEMGSWTVRVTNPDLAEVSGAELVVNDLPESFVVETPVPSGGTWDEPGRTLTWSGVTVPANDFLDFTFEMSPECEAGTGRQMEAVVTPGNASAISSQVEKRDPLLLLTLLDSDENSVTDARVGDTINWTLTVENIGDGDLIGDGATVEFTLGGDFSFVSISSTSGNNAPASLTPGSPVTWQTGLIDAGGEAIYEISAEVNECTRDELVNTVSASWTCPQDGGVDATASAALEILEPELSINIVGPTPSPISYCGGSSVSVSIENSGNGPAENLTLEVPNWPATWDATPADGSGVDFDPVSKTFRLPDVSQTTTFDFDFTIEANSCNPAGSATLFFVPNYVNQCGPQDGTEYFTPVTDPAVWNFGPRSGDPAADPPIPAFTVEKTGPAEALLGDTGLVYEFTVTYEGPAPPDGGYLVDIVDDYPGTFGFVSASPAGNHDAANTRVTWADVSFTASGQSEIFTVTLDAPGTDQPCDAFQSYPNTASVVNIRPDVFTDCNSCSDPIAEASDSVQTFIPDVNGPDITATSSSRINDNNVCEDLEIQAEWTFDTGAPSEWDGISVNAEITEGGSLGTPVLTRVDVAGTDYIDDGDGPCGTSFPLDLACMAGPPAPNTGATLTIEYSYPVDNQEGDYRTEATLTVSSSTGTGCAGTEGYNVAADFSVEGSEMTVDARGEAFVDTCGPQEFEIEIGGFRNLYDAEVVLNTFGNYTYVPGETDSSDLLDLNGTPLFDPPDSIPDPTDNGDGTWTWDFGDIRPQGIISFEMYRNCSDADPPPSPAWTATGRYHNDCENDGVAPLREVEDTHEPLLIKDGNPTLHMVPAEIRAVNPNPQVTIYVVNGGSGALQDGELRITFDPDVAYLTHSLQSGSGPDDDTATPGSRDVLFEFNEIPPGGQEALVITTSLTGCEELGIDSVFTWCDGDTQCEQPLLKESVITLGGTEMTVTTHTGGPVDYCGDETTFTLAARNSGRVDVYDVQLVELLPPGVVYTGTFTRDATGVTLSGAPTVTTEMDGDQQRVVFDFSDVLDGVNVLPVGAEISVTLNAEIDSTILCDAAALFGDNRQAEATARFNRPCEATSDTTRSASAPRLLSVQPANPNIRLTKEARNTTKNPTGPFVSGEVAADPDDIIEWRITVESNGSFVAKDVDLTDTLPGNVTYVSGSGELNGSPLSDGWETGLDLGDLNPGVSNEIVFQTEVDDCEPLASNTVTATYGCCKTEPDSPAVQTATAEMDLRTRPDFADTRLDLSHSGWTTCGGDVTIAITNNGGTATTREIVDTLPEGYRYVVNSAEITASNTPPGVPRPNPFVDEPDVISADGRTLTWNDSNIDFVAPGETITITFQVQPDGTYCDSDPANDPVSPIPTLTNGVAYDYTDACDVDASDSATDDINPLQPDIDIEIEPIQQIRAEGELAEWRVTLTNNGNASADNISLTDILGDGFGDASTQPTDDGGGSWTRNGDQWEVTWDAADIGVLDDGDSWTVNLSAEVNSGSLTHNAAVTGDCGVSGPTCTYTYDEADAYTAGFEMSKTVDQAEANIGEELTYRVTAVFLNTDEFQNMTLVDTLPPGVEVQSFQALDGTTTPNGTNSNALFDSPVQGGDLASGQTLTWTANGGNFNGSATLDFEVVARIRNEAGIVGGATLSNGVQANFDISFQDGEVVSFSDDVQVQTTAREPLLQVTKTITPGSADAGDQVTIELTVENIGDGTAYSVVVSDLINDIDNNGSADTPVVYDCDTLAPNPPPTGDWSVATPGTAPDCEVEYTLNDGALLAPGASATFSFTAEVDPGVITGTSYENIGQAEAHSLPFDDGERSDTDYDRTPNGEGGDTLAVSAPVVNDKTITATSEGEAPSTETTVLVGEVISYRLPFTIPNGVSSNVLLVDDISDFDGLAYVDGSARLDRNTANLTASVNPGGINGNTPGTSVAVSPDTSNAGEIRLSLGTVTNNSGGSAEYILTLDCVVENIPAVNAGTDLTDRARIEWADSGGNDQSQTGNDVTVTVAEPIPSIAKTANPTEGQGGDAITFTVNLCNDATATAPAFDWRVEDPLPSGKFENFAVTNVEPGTTGANANASFTGNILSATIDRLDPDECVGVTYQADLTTSVVLGEEIENVATFTTTSLPDSAAGERNGDDVPGGEPNDLGGSASATVSVLAPSSLTKTTVNPQAVYPIGDRPVFRLTIPVPSGRTDRFVVTDDLPDGLPFVPGSLDVVLPPGGTAGNATDESPPFFTLDTANNDLIFDFGTLEVPTAGDLVIEYQTEVSNILANQVDTELLNTVELVYEDPDNPGSDLTVGPTDNDEPVIVGEPNLELGKTLGPDTNPDPQPGGTVQWRVFITNNGNATAFQVNFEEILPDGLFDIRNVTVTNEDGDVFRNNTTIPLDEDDATVSTTTNPNDTLTLSPFQIAGGGARTTIVFDCTVESDVAPGEEITNAVRAAYTSLPDGGRDNSTNPGNVDDDDDSDLNNYEESTERTLNAATGAVGDTVWLDDNDNGVRDAGESGIPNVRVDLLDPDANVIDGVVTDADGRYSFTGIPAGDYGAQVDAGTLPPGLTQTAAPPDSFTVPADGAFLDADFGYQNTSTTTALAGDRVWHDADGDGVQDPGEPGIGGVTLDLLSAGPDGVFATGDDVREDSDTTGAAGDYLFPDISPGEYIVAVTDTGGVLNGYTLTGGTNPSAPFTLAGGDIYLNADFGYQNPALFSISDRVWLDANGDGLYDSGESGISGVTVTLRDRGTGDGIATTTSGADGRFTFPGLPDGDYIVSVTDTANRLAGLFPTTANACCGNLPVTVAGADETGENFGYNRAGLIGDTVWNDANGNGVQDPGEAGIDGVTVNLLGPGSDGNFDTADDEVLATETTDSGGAYLFENLDPGLYRVDVTDTESVLTDFNLTTANDPTTDLNLGAGESILDADFGYQNPNLFSITNRVWIDSDSDGTQNGGESGAPDVTVTLLDDGGTPIASATTDGSGDFTFPGLAPGDYTLQITDLAGRLNGFTGTTAAGQNGTLGVTVVDADLSAVDFGYVQSVVTGTIGDLVWRDENGNGVPDGTESGIGGATVFLDADGDGVLDPGETSTDTAGDGSYLLSNLPAGLYTVAVDESSLPAGLALTTANEPLAVALSAGEDFPDADFGYQEQGEVFGHLFVDVNGDGIQQTDEPDLPGVDVVMTDSRGNDIRVTTDADGNYRASVPAGAATVDVDETTLPAGYLQTAGTDPDTVTVPAGGSVNAGDDGYQPRGTIEGHLFIDENGDGVQNAGEPDLPGIDVIVTDAAGAIQTVTTDDNGDWSADVSAGEATADVDETTLPPGYVQTAGTDPSSVDVPSGGTADAGDDGYQRQNGVIRDFVWNDRNGDGLQDPDEPGLEGVVVYLDLDGNGARDATDPSAVTDADGRYAIGGLPQGNYTVRVDEETIPQGFVQTGGADPLSVSLAEAEDFPDADFGYQRRDGLIGDLVWEDRNGNGVRDPGEPGISDVTVFLDANGNGTPDPGESSTVTGADGGYAFSGLIEGEYAVAVDDATLPAGLGLSGGSDPLPVSLAAGQEFRDADFGYSGAAGAIGDRVWIDLNGNGVDDPGEPGIPNATVRLLDETGARIDQIPTDADGRYRFSDLSQGIYTVDVVDDTIPAGLTTTDDPSPAISLSAGEFFDEADFGYTSETGVIGDTVWRDANGDGVQNPGESGIGGVTVALTAAGPDGLLDTADDVSAGTAATAADGSYAFSGLDAGRYRVAVTDTAGILANATLTGGTDPTAPIDLAAGQAFLNADFGYQIPDRFTLTDRLWRDDNANGAQDGGEPGFAGVTVTLLDAGGRGIATDISDAAGDVQFPGLPDGDYTLVVTDTAGVLDDFADTTPPATAGFLDATIAGADVSGINFGYNRPGAVGDTVFSDADGDGLQGPGEPGIVGVTLALVDPGADDVPGTADDVRIAAAETGPDGGYLFPGLAADRYGVVVTDDGNVLDGFTLTSGNAPFGPFDLAAGASRLDADFGYQRGDLPDVSGTIWNDLDAGATREPGEPLFPDVTVRLVDAQERTVAETNTGPDGSFRFSDVPPGDYTVTVTDLGSVLEGFGRTTPAAEYPITVLDADIPGLDFGYVRNPDRGSIGDLVWVDANGNGRPDPGEGRAGVRLTLQGADGNVVAETVTGADGTYAFTDLPPGDYRVLVDRDTLPADVDPLSDPDGGLDDLADVVNLTADRLDVDFGYRPRDGGDPSPPPVDRTARLGDFVWEDLNQNGVQDPGEPGVSGVVVRLFNSGGTVFLAQTTTDADGRYRFFGLTPGSYQVAFEAPNGFSFTNPGQGNAARDSNPDPATGRAGASVSAGSAVLDIDAGLIRAPKIAFGDLVWRDDNGNGRPDSGEGLPGVRLILTDGTGAAVAETVTDGTGGYRFAGLPPGDYQIQVDPASLPAGLVLLADPEGAIDGGAVLPNQNADNLNVDFGYRPVGPLGDLSGAVKTGVDENGGELLPGDVIAYTATVRNEGAAPAREVVYVDTPDPFTRLVPGSVETQRGRVVLGNGAGDLSIRVAVGEVGIGEAIRIRYRATVAGDTPPGAWMVNQGNVLAAWLPAVPTDWPDSSPLNDPTVLGPIPGGGPVPNVGLSKSVTDRDGDPLQPGDELLYTLIVRNDGPGTATGLMLFDSPSSAVSLVPGSVSGDRGTGLAGDPIEWIVGELEPGETFTARFRVRVNGGAGQGALLCNQAALIGDGGIWTGSGAPECETACLTVAPVGSEGVAIRAVKVVSDLDGGGFAPGEPVGYRITLVNGGDASAEAVVFTDVFDGRVNLVSGSVVPSRGAVETGNGPADTEVRVAVGTMAPGERVEIVLEARISPDAADGEIISNQGQVEWTGGNAPTDDPATTTPDDPTDVVVVQPEGERIPPRGFKSARGDWPLVSWTLRYENDDDRPMVLHVEDPIPAGARLVADSVTATFGTAGVRADPERVIWDGEVPAGGAVEIGYRVRVDDGVFRLDNQACAIWDRDGDRLWTDEPDAGTGWICTDDPTTPAVGDPTGWTRGCELSLGDRVWIDTDADGVCRFVEERRPDGVRLSLYRDADGDNHFSPGVDPLLETTVADARNGVPGLYRFEDLCPGDYIVGVDAANFGPGGALEGMRPTHFGGDPDNDRDDDSNAEIVPDAGIFSPAVTLDPRTEPDFEDGDPMSNLTVDFGFVPPPPAPEACPECGPFKPF
jgi:fimbrial isopeptide formation D2 family protein/uncharacterized repeat protein (TIGR01451 family)